MVTLARNLVRANVGVTTPFRHKTGCSTMLTTGSMSADSNILTVASALDFRVGDWIIVECGGEAAGGTRGHPGVGGTSPDLSYATKAEMDADTTQPDGKTAWVRDTGDAWLYRTDTQTWSQSVAFGAGNDYYRLKVVPRALNARIEAINGNSLTLSKSAHVATTNANVYFDNWGIVRNTLVTKNSIALPAGTLAMSDRVYLKSQSGLSIQGAGKTATVLKTPKGACHGGFFFEFCPNAVIRDLTIDCAFKNENYGFPYALESRSVTEGDEPLINRRYEENIDSQGGWRYGQCLHFLSSSDSEVRNCTMLNPAQHAVTTGNSYRVWVYNCTARIEDPIRIYIQWMFHFADIFNDSGGGGFVDCNVDSDWFVPGFNCFKTQNVSFIRCTGRNAHFANNASDGALIEDMTLIFEPLKAFDEQSGPIGRALFEFSTNVGSGYDETPATVRNLRIHQEGYSNADERQHTAIVIGASSCPVNFEGTYDTDPISPKGLISTVEPWAGINAFDGLAMRIAGTVTVEGMRFTGALPIGWNGSASVPRSLVYTESGGSVTVTNCILDDGDTGNGSFTGSGNQTNAEYEA